MTILALMLAQALFGNVYQPGDEELLAESSSSATELFRDVCVAPFPDIKKFHTAMRGHVAKLEQVAPDEIGMVGAGRKLRASPGEFWRSTQYHLSYFALGSLGLAVPQPQCRVTVRLSDAIDHATLVSQVSQLLGVIDPHVPPKNPPRVTYWDTGPDGDHRRILLKSEASKRGNFMSLSLLILPKP